MQVAPAPAPQGGDAPAPELEQAAGLGAGRDQQILLAVEGLDPEVGAEGGLGHREAQHVEEVVTVALEARVGPHGDGHVEVAGLAAPGGGRPPAGQAEPLAVVDARRDLDLDGGGEGDPPVAPAVAAGREDLPARPPAGGAGGGGHHLAEDGAADGADLAGAAAGAAGRRVGAGLAAGTGAALALDRHAQLDRLRRPEDGLLEVEDQVDLGVGAPGRAGRAPAAAEAAAEEGVEEVGDAEVEPAGPGPPPAPMPSAPYMS